MPDYRDRFRALVRPDRQPLRAEAPSRGGDDTTAVIRLYDPIDSWGEFWGVSAKELATVLDGLPDTVTTIELLINSPGGEVFDGIAILNLLRRHPAKVVAIVEGLAASCASFIACGVDECVMAPNAELMVHDAWGLCVGNAQDMRDLAEDLDRLSDNIASVYAQKAGGDLADWRAVMARETWYSAEEAVTAGLADRLDVAAKPADEAKARHDLSIFNFSGRHQAPGPQDPAAPPGRRASTSTEGSPAVAFSDEQFIHLRQALGLQDDADEKAIFAALDVKLQEYVEEPAPDPSPAAAPTIPDGHVVVPEARLRDLEAGVHAGVQAAKSLHEKERSEFLDSVRSKYLADNRKGWEDEYDRDPEATRKHFASAPDIVPVNAIGNGGSVDLDLDREYEAIYGKQEAKV